MGMGKTFGRSQNHPRRRAREKSMFAWPLSCRITNTNMFTFRSMECCLTSSGHGESAPETRSFEPLLNCHSGYVFICLLDKEKSLVQTEKSLVQMTLKAVTFPLYLRTKEVLSFFS